MTVERNSISDPGSEDFLFTTGMMQERIELTKKDWEVLLESLRNPPKSNARLKKGFAAYVKGTAEMELRRAEK